VFKNCNAWDKSNIVFKGRQIVRYDKKNKTEDMDYIDYGMGILKKSSFSAMVSKDVFDLAELYQGMISKKQMSAYEVPERFYEIGSMSGLADTERFIFGQNGRGHD